MNAFKGEREKTSVLVVCVPTKVCFRVRGKLWPPFCLSIFICDSVLGRTFECDGLSALEFR